MKKNVRPKIAVIGLKGLPAFGGAATVGENIIEQLKDKYDFTVYSVSSHTNEKTGEFHGFKQIVFNQIKKKKINTLVYYIKATTHILFKSKYDLIHLHHRDAAFIIPFLRLRNRVILTTHGMVLTDKWKSLRWLFNLQDSIFLRLANIITTVSLKDKRIVKSILSKKEQIIYIPNGVNLKDQLIKQSEGSLVFAAGRIIPNKGCHVFLKALIKLNYKGQVKIIGDLDQMPIYKKELESLAEKIENIEFIGLIKDKNALNQYISSAKLFVYPSEIESMSMMMLEVASFKTPLICCNIPENRDIFDDEQLLYFQPGNSEDLAVKIEWALANYSLMQERAEKAFLKLKDNYQWVDIAKQYDKVYESLIAK